MAAIKAYSDLQQSKKLAEILPLESADMYYEEICNLPKAIIGNYILHNQCMEDKDYKKLSNPVLSPAWSLAALLKLIPDSIYENTDDFAQVEITKRSVGYHDMNDNIVIGTLAGNLVDACYKMILKLNELNLL